MFFLLLIAKFSSQYTELRIEPTPSEFGVPMWHKFWRIEKLNQSQFNTIVIFLREKKLDKYKTWVTSIQLSKKTPAVGPDSAPNVIEFFITHAETERLNKI